MSIARIALAGLLAFAAAPSQAPAPKPTPLQQLAQLSWLAGTWRLQDGATTTDERWLPLAGSTMLGLSHTYDAETTKFFEFLRIAAKNGTVAYIAQPGGGKAVPFPAVTLNDHEAVFENATHDHPQRIRYERTEKGVTATISMLDGARASSFVFERKPE